jgi:hypothetical protein
MKKIKINWGKGLALGMGAFMLFIIAMGVYMFRQSPDDYDHQYYEKGLAYDSVYNQEKQVVNDKAQPSLKIQGDELAINFISPVNGSIRFERPSDPGMDKIVHLKSGDGSLITVPLNKFQPGRWKLTFDWENAGKKYLYQQELNLP